MRHRSTMDDVIRDRYSRLTKLLIDRQLTISTMESATSGQIASLITDTVGSSAVFKGAFVAYTNETKIMMGVSEDTIKTYGVYSQETAYEMAKLAKTKMNSNISIGVTGTFGNVDPNNADSVEGEVYYCILIDRSAIPDKNTLEFELDNDKNEVFMIADRNRLDPKDSRQSYKLQMASIIAHEILKALL